MEETEFESDNVYKMPENLRLAREKWYSQTFVMLEMIKACQHRELAFLMDKAVPRELRKGIRYSVAIKIDYVKDHFKAFNFFNRNFNLYHSIATLKPFPLMSYNLKERKKSPDYINFDKNYMDYVLGFDLFLDFDGGDKPELALKEMREVKSILDVKKVPYYVVNSSLKGFHIKIPYEYMPTYGQPVQALARIVSFIRRFKTIYLFETLDETVIDPKRVAKLPYSIVGDLSVCLPLSDLQIANFRPEMVLMSEVLRITRIKNRGLIVRTHGLTFEQLRENTKSFIEEYL